MPGLFEEITRATVRELGFGGNMIAVRNAIDADRFHCFCLVREKRSFLGLQYCKTDLTLKDILEEEESERPNDELESETPGQRAEFQFLDNVDLKAEFTMKLPRAITIKGMSGEFQGTQKQGIKILLNRISQQHLLSLENRKLKRKLPSSFQSIQAKREGLYLVTETLETKNEETLRSDRRYKFFNWRCLEFEHQHKKEVTIPPKWVLGFRIKQLVFPNQERMSKEDLVFVFQAKQNPFWKVPHRGDRIGMDCSPNSGLNLLEKDGGSSLLGKSLNLEDVRSMKEQVQDMGRGLQDLTEEEQKDVLSCLTNFLSKDGQLQDLEQRVSEVLSSGELQIEGPASPLIGSLFNAVGILEEARAEAILALLDALTELSKEEQQLVAEALEKGILPQLLDQVETILEQNLDEQLGSPSDKDCDPEEQSICALYVALSILLQLAKGPTSAPS